MKRSRSYDGNECPLVEAHGPMLDYPSGMFYCPNAGHSRADPPETALFRRGDDGWQVAIALGGWTNVIKSEPDADPTSASGSRP